MYYYTPVSSQAAQNSYRAATARSGAQQSGCGSTAMYCYTPVSSQAAQNPLPSRDCKERCSTVRLRLYCHVLLHPGYVAGYAEFIPSRDCKERYLTVRLRLRAMYYYTLVSLQTTQNSCRAATARSGTQTVRLRFCCHAGKANSSPATGTKDRRYNRIICALFSGSPR
jgi:hypothetical protein